MILSEKDQWKRLVSRWSLKNEYQIGRGGISGKKKYVCDEALTAERRTSF